MSRPLNQIRPALGARWPEIVLIKVVLPAPFGPIIQWTSPASSRKSMSSLATSPRKRFVRPCVLMSSATTQPSRRRSKDTFESARHPAPERDNHRDEHDA